MGWMRERRIRILVGPLGEERPREDRRGTVNPSDTTHGWAPELDNRLPNLRMTEHNAHEQDTLP